ncbi:twin-arginine translocation signal domain-containing protein [Halomarina rubra]|uniref:Twin-arginine translocation signal domain-containing protein n=1 Tax=Halomarina rubra TaxID=2071873 RepID=A0ABD6AR93_9EURY|nr:twin-arginine translocation signal domain-containing protein [Halomarina rubra]
MNPPHSRRSFLKATGAAALSLPLAGCSALDSSSGGVVLGDVLISNFYDDPQTVRVELERDGDDGPIYEGVHTVDPPTGRVGGLTVVEATWPETPAVYELTYTVREDETMDVRRVHLTAESIDEEHVCAAPRISLGAWQEPYSTVQIEGRAGRSAEHCPASTRRSQTTSDRN